MANHFLRLLRSQFDRSAKRAALVYGDQVWTYGELNAAANRCAAWLQQLGAKEGDRVALFTPNKLAFFVGHLGVLFAGAVPVPLNPRFTRGELQYFLDDSGARVVIVGTEQKALVEEVACELVLPPAIVPDSQCLQPPIATPRELDTASDDPCLMLYSSGTTGWPKGVVHTQASAASGLLALARCWQMSPDDVVVNTLPLFHIHGLAFATHLTWLTGGTLIVEDVFEPQRTMADIGRATVFMGVPTIYYRLLEEPEFRSAARQWQSVRLFTCGSAPIRQEVLPELESVLGRPVINRYGMTEAYVIASLPLDGPWPHGSVGLPLDGVELRIVNEDGNQAAADEVGAVQIRGPNVFREYWKKREETKKAFRDGWFDTGDLGRRDAPGFLTLVGRKNDLIIVSGYNVYPQVVERVIAECPGVTECAVFGVPDVQRGEKVAAAVVRNDAQLDETRLAAWCKERLVYYQRPSRVAFVESLPKNSLGKIQRNELRKAFG